MGERARKHFERRFTKGFEMHFAQEAGHVSEQNYRNMTLNKAIRVVFKELLGREDIEEELFGNRELIVRKQKLPENPVISQRTKRA